MGEIGDIVPPQEQPGYLEGLKKLEERRRLIRENREKRLAASAEAKRLREEAKASDPKVAEQKRLNQKLATEKHRQKMARYEFEEKLERAGVDSGVRALGPGEKHPICKRTSAKVHRKTPPGFKLSRRGGERDRLANTLECKEFLRLWLTSQDYRTNAIARIMAGKAQHLEILWHHLAFGRPKEEVEVNIQQMTGLIIRVDASYTPERMLEVMDEAARMGTGAQPCLPESPPEIRVAKVVVQGEQPPAVGVPDEPEEVRPAVRDSGGGEDGSPAAETPA